MKIDNIKNLLKYQDYIYDDCIRFLVNHYIDNKNINIRKYNLFNWYNIKGTEYIFVGTFDKDDYDEKTLYYVFLKKGLYNQYDKKYNMNFCIFSYYDIYLNSVIGIDNNINDINICFDKIRSYIMENLK